MTTINSEIKKCIHCGFETKFDVVCSTSSFGPCDLDSRPAPLARDAIRYNIERCPKCNYASSDISEEKEFNPEILKSDKYLKILNSSYLELAKAICLRL